MDRISAGESGDAPVERVEFHCDRRRLAGIVVANILLTIVTFGIYRFWARTRLRREFWSMLRFRGEPLVYTGTGRELFIGFLIAMVALVPVFVVIQVILVLIPPTSLGLRFLVQLGFAVALGALALLGLFYARRYLLSRTRWRGIQAGQDNDLGGFILVHLKAYAGTMLSLGIAQPWADAKTYNYRMGITRFGTGRFGAAAESDPLWAPWAVTWILVALGYGLLIAWSMPIMTFSAAVEAARQSGAAAPAPPELNFWGLVAPVVLLLLSMVGFYVYAVQRFRHFTNATWFETMGFRCDLPLSTILPLIGGYMVIWTAAVAGAGYIVYLSVQSLGPQVGVLVGFALGLLLMMLVNGIALLCWVYVELLRRITTHLEISGPDALDEVVNRGAPEMRRGEGLADALGDVGMAV